jgi:hypothetical protein
LNGLEFCIQTYGYKKSWVAEQVGTKNPNLSAWFSTGKKGSRPIPEDKLNKICEVFPNIPRKYFTKELTEWERLDILEIYLRETDVADEYEDFTYHNGEKVKVTQKIYQNQAEVQEIQQQKNHLKFIERVERLTGDMDIEGLNKKMMTDFMDILESGNERFLAVLQMTLLNLSPKVWGIHPAYSALRSQKQMYIEFEKLLEKFKVFDEE